VVSKGLSFPPFFSLEQRLLLDDEFLFFAEQVGLRENAIVPFPSFLFSFHGEG